MFPPSARAALNSVRFKGVYQRVAMTNSDNVYYGWNDDAADSLAVQSSYLTCGVINQPNCDCCGDDGYGNCNTCATGRISPLAQYNSNYNGNLSTGWYHTSGNLKNTGWKYIVNFAGGGDTAVNCDGTCAGSATVWANVAGDAGGLARSIGIKYDNTMWSWGAVNFEYNTFQGRNTITSTASPTQIGTLSTWKVIISDSAGTTAYALKTDNTLWAWGLNGSYQIGDGTATNRSSPVQIGTLSTWATVTNFNGNGYDSACAIKLDGTLWCWGSNVAGQLGLNSTTTRVSPVQVGTLSDWKKIHAGYGYFLAVKTNGTLWAWGLNTDGNLGDGSVANRSSPVQIGTLSTWLTVAADNFESYAIKTDGTLWGWGNGAFYGGGSAQRSSPVQLVTSITNFLNFVGGYAGSHGCAIRADKKNITCGNLNSTTGSTYITANGPYFEATDDFFKSKVQVPYGNSRQFNLLKTG